MLGVRGKNLEWKRVAFCARVEEIEPSVLTRSGVHAEEDELVGSRAYLVAFHMFPRGRAVM
jgi:hypothetical protein